jgi:hypothetical protein
VFASLIGVEKFALKQKENIITIYHYIFKMQKIKNGKNKK